MSILDTISATIYTPIISLDVLTFPNFGFN